MIRGRCCCTTMAARSPRCPCPRRPPSGGFTERVPPTCGRSESEGSSCIRMDRRGRRLHVADRGQPLRCLGSRGSTMCGRWEEAPLGPGPNDVLLHYDGCGVDVGLTAARSRRDLFQGLGAVLPGRARGRQVRAWPCTTTEPTGAKSPPAQAPRSSPCTAVRAASLRWAVRRRRFLQVGRGGLETETLHPAMSGSLTGLFVDASGTIFVTGEHYQRFRRDASSGNFADDTEAPGALRGLARSVGRREMATRSRWGATTWRSPARAWSRRESWLAMARDRSKEVIMSHLAWRRCSASSKA